MALPRHLLFYDGNYISLNLALKKAIPELKFTGDDISGGQTIQCTLQLEDIIPSRIYRR